MKLVYALSAAAALAMTSPAHATYVKYVMAVSGSGQGNAAGAWGALNFAGSYSFSFDSASVVTSPTGQLLFTGDMFAQSSANTLALSESGPAQMTFSAVFAPGVLTSGLSSDFNGDPLTSSLFSYQVNQHQAIWTIAGKIDSITTTSSVTPFAEGMGFKVLGETFSTGAVPEPATWSLMIGGFGLVGAALRRREKVGRKMLG